MVAYLKPVRKGLREDNARTIDQILQLLFNRQPPGDTSCRERLGPDIS